MAEIKSIDAEQQSDQPATCVLRFVHECLLTDPEFIIRHE